MMATRATDYDAAVLGLGETGVACVRHLRALGHRVVAVDSREQSPGAASLSADCPDVVQHHGGFDADLLARADMLVVSPGIDPRQPPIAAARDRGVPVIGEIELFARAARAPVTAITGSNGKSTVTTLVAAMCRADGRDAGVGGNLGPAALTLLTEPERSCYVLELSSFQLETVTSLNAAAAVVLNISADHMDRYDTVADYAAAKARIYRGDGVAVVNADDPAVEAMAPTCGRTVRFSLSAPAGPDDAGLLQHEGDAWLALGGEPVLAVAELPLAGSHNVANALAALALGRAMGLTLAGMARGLAGYQGLPHRMESLGEHAGLRWYNDSKATNVGATAAAVRGLEGPFVLIAGGQGKGQAFEPLVEALAGRARGVVLIGESADTIAGALDGRVACTRAEGMAEAVARAAAMGRPGDAVLLSPACASFDQFTGYAQRGEAFRRAVGGLSDG